MTIDAAGDPTAASVADERPPWKQPKLIGAAAGVGVLGLLLGMAFRPELAVNEGPKPPMQAITPMAEGPQMAIVVDPPKPLPEITTKPGKLEVLPPDMVAAAPRAPVRAAPAEPLVAPDPLPRLAEVDPRDRPRPSFDCRSGALSRAEALVCDDPALAAADRRMAAAFRRATQAGVPYEQLRDEQDDWMSIRERAARRSPEAVAQIYAQRIDELDEMAREDW